MSSAEYASIHPETRWRWVPYAIAPVALGVMTLWILFDPENEWIVLWMAVNSLLFLPVVVSWHKVGSPWGFWIAQREARLPNRIRVNTSPVLAIAVRSTGCVMAALYVIVISLESGILFPAGLAIAVSCPTFPLAALIMLVWGWQRPWDLLVVVKEG